MRTRGLLGAGLWAAVALGLAASAALAATPPPPPAPPLFPPAPASGGSGGVSSGGEAAAPGGALPVTAEKSPSAVRGTVSPAAAGASTPGPPGATGSPGASPSATPSPGPAPSTVVTQVEERERVPTWLLIALAASGVLNLGTLGAYLNRRLRS